jgi:hypothetical protein
MSYRIGKLAVVSSFVLAAGVWIAACRQDEGGRCQTSKDCTGDLVCNQATQTCAQGIGGGLDANVPELPPPDAFEPDTTIDAPATDASIDSSVDSSIDAT